MEDFVTIALITPRMEDFVAIAITMGGSGLEQNVLVGHYELRLKINGIFIFLAAFS